MEFEFAKVTNSRLMGSMGLRISWKDDESSFDQYFLLDAEGLAVADYLSLRKEDCSTLEREENRLMGGLGSDRIYIDEKEAIFLVKYYSDKNRIYNKPLPKHFDECSFFLDKYFADVDIENIFLKLCKKIDDPIEFINYMTMRFIARDREALFIFSKNVDISNMHITNINGILLKNEIKKCSTNKYLAKALYEDDDGHYICKLGFDIDFENRKINSIMFVNKKQIDSLEVLEEIRKIEYISLYKIDDRDNFLIEFEKLNSSFMKTKFENGMMFTRFNENNDHVKNCIYNISDDIHSIFYITKNNQMIVSSYEENQRMYLTDFLLNGYSEYVCFEKEYIFDASVIYEFAEEGFDDFYEFLNYEE